MTLKITNISKTYPSGVQALKRSPSIRNGMYGLLGPNRAGKSTLMRILATLQEPDEGSVHLINPPGDGRAKPGSLRTKTTAIETKAGTWQLP